MKARLITISILFTAIFITCFNASATPVTGFEAGRIIDDVVFTNKSAMNISQIQAFLDSKVPSCNTWHTGFTGSSGTWYGPPFTCLKSYSENGKSSSQIIYDAAQTYNINPQVLIVLLQKEQSLITDDWPASYQYKTATGYGCPDGADCNSNYFGFTNQVTWAAKMFRAIINDSPTWYTPYETGNNYIQYNPIASCGGSTVYIENRSTQALYNYTPYQPNSSALAAGYSLGDGCGAYGNRNFYLYFTDWFGSTKAINGTITISQPLTVNKSNIVVGDTINASYEVSNSANYNVIAGEFGICARINGKNYDLGFNSESTIAANSKKIITYSKTINEAGDINIFTCSFLDQLGGWASDKYPYNISNLQRTLTIQVKDNPLITTNVSFSPASPAAGQPVTAAFTITNASSSSVNAGSPVVAMRSPNGRNVDFAMDEPVTIAANSTYTYSKTTTFNEAGTYTFFVSNYKDGGWNADYPKSSDSNILRKGTIQVK